MSTSKRIVHIYRYEVTLKDGSVKRFRSTKEIKEELGITRYYVDSMVNGAKRHETITGKRRCDKVLSIKPTHCDKDGNEIPVLPRRAWYAK